MSLREREKERERERERERETDRQTYRQTDRQRKRQSQRRMHRRPNLQSSIVGRMHHCINDGGERRICLHEKLKRENGRENTRHGHKQRVSNEKR